MKWSQDACKPIFSQETCITSKLEQQEANNRRPVKEFPKLVNPDSSEPGHGHSGKQPPRSRNHHDRKAALNIARRASHTTRSVISSRIPENEPTCEDRSAASHPPCCERSTLGNFQINQHEIPLQQETMPLLLLLLLLLLNPVAQIRQRIC